MLTEFNSAPTLILVVHVDELSIPNFACLYVSQLDVITTPLHMELSSFEYESSLLVGLAKRKICHRVKKVHL